MVSAGPHPLWVSLGIDSFNLPASGGSRHSLAVATSLQSLSLFLYYLFLCMFVSSLVLFLMRTLVIGFGPTWIIQDDFISRSLTSLHLEDHFFFPKEGNMHSFQVFQCGHIFWEVAPFSVEFSLYYVLRNI